MKKGFPARVCLLHVSVTQSSSFIKSLGAKGPSEGRGESFQLSSSSFQASNATFDVVERVFWQKDFYVEHKKGERKINRIEQKHRAREKSLK
jgi:hypothetical protein